MPTLPDLSPADLPPPRRSFIAAALGVLAAGLSWPAVSLAAPRRASPPLQLAREAPEHIDPAGFLVSEKLDGVRAAWDGERLRFRSGLPVMAPRWFTARLPALPLDGELWLGRGRFDVLSGTVRRAAALDPDWQGVRYVVFDLRDEDGRLGPFARRVERVREAVAAAGFAPLQAAEQRTLADRAALKRWLDEVVRAGGEGLMLHRADARWRAGRSDALLKLKPEHDAEAVVVAHVAGQGRHTGRLGALHVRTAAGVEFLLGTGLTDAERERPPAVGTVVTYTHRGLTASGVPRFASFLRVRDPLRS
ncbi:MAG: DNA ligase [Rubrivivax sp.]|nr:DNA ligase [Rubrivivax sp.]